MRTDTIGRSPETFVANHPEQLAYLTGPLGATIQENGTRFAVVVGQNAERVTCCIHDPQNLEHIIGTFKMSAAVADPDVAAPRQEFSVFIPNNKGISIGEGTLYTYEVDGRNVLNQKDNPNSFDNLAPPVDLYNGKKKHIDPRAHAVFEKDGIKVGVVVSDEFEWGDDTPPKHEDKIILELHVKGATMQFEDISEELRGTYAGMSDDAFIDYLVKTGCTHVELLPVTEREDSIAANGVTMQDYWGYNPTQMFSPYSKYAHDQSPGGPTREFKSMVKKLHAHGIGVILDVVYNHTGEQGLQGIDNDGYYMHGADNNPINNNGCGTNFDCSRPQGQSLMVDSLEYWAQEMHVDGFRFDLAPVIARQHSLGGAIDTHNFSDTPAINAINSSPILRGKSLIAEAWDSWGRIEDRFGFFADTGLWQEWNGFYRDLLRDTIRGNTTVRQLSAMVLGEIGLKEAIHSINFLDAHDGFTAFDLVTYNDKVNWANGEWNCDGEKDNRSYNNGYEGQTDDAYVMAARLKAVRNAGTILLASNGVVMMLGGDDLLNTQYGNNNPWNQDNPLSWLKWNGLEEYKYVHQRFTQANVQYRRSQPQFFAQNQPRTRIIFGNRHNPGDHEWFGPKGQPMLGEDWADDKKILGLFRPGGKFGSRVDDALVYHNFGHEAAAITLPQDKWVSNIFTKVLDTATGEAHTNATKEERINKEFVLDSLSTVVLRGRNS